MSSANSDSEYSEELEPDENPTEEEHAVKFSGNSESSAIRAKKYRVALLRSISHILSSKPDTAANVNEDKYSPQKHEYELSTTSASPEEHDKESSKPSSSSFAKETKDEELGKEFLLCCQEGTVESKEKALSLIEEAKLRSKTVRSAKLRTKDENGLTGLHHAAGHGFADVVEKNAKLDPLALHDKGKDKLTPLLIAVAKNKVEVVKVILEASKETILAETASGETAIHLACMAENTDCYNQIIRTAKDFLNTFERKRVERLFTKRNTKDMSPIITAMDHKHFEIVKDIIKKYPSEDPVCTTERKETCAHLALASKDDKKKERIELAIFIVDNNYDVMYCLDDSNRSLLDKAILCEDSNSDIKDTAFYRLIEIYLKKTNVVNFREKTQVEVSRMLESPETLLKNCTKKFRQLFHKRDSWGFQMIHLACISGCLSIFNFITKCVPGCLKSRVKPPAELGGIDYLPLHLAALFQHIDIVRECLSKYPEQIYATTNEDMKAFHLAISSPNIKDELFNFFVEEDTYQLVFFCRHNESPLHIMQNFAGIDLKAMIEHIDKCGSNFDYGKKSSLGNTIAHSFAYAGSLDGLKILDGKGVNLDVANNDGNTPIGEAARRSHVECIEYLISRNCRVDHANQCDETPFLMACKAQQFKVIQLLGERPDVNVRQKDNKGNSALLLLFENPLKEGKNYELEFETALKYLIGKGLETSRENKAHENIFFRTINHGKSNLVKILPMLGDSVKTKNSKGMNVVHYLASKCKDIETFVGIEEQNFRNTCERYLTWSDDKSQYDNLRVKTGIYEGYTCLHFACQADQDATHGKTNSKRIWKDNIAFLLKRGFKLSDRLNPKKLTCVDLAVLLHNVHLLVKVSDYTTCSGVFSSEDFIQGDEILRLVDDITRALQLPKKDEAKMHLLPSCDTTLAMEVTIQRYNEKRYKYGNVVNMKSGNIEEFPTLTRLLAIAFKDDSPIDFRGIATLGVWRFSPTETDSWDFVNFIYSQVQLEPKRLRKFFPEIADGFNKLCEKTSKNLQYKNGLFDTSFPSLLCLAIRSGRISIAMDLIVTEQFHVIPACLQTIIECKRIVREENAGQSNLQVLQDFATGVLLNSLDFLILGANKKKRKLIYDYILGNFEHKDEKGPKFMIFERIERKEMDEDVEEVEKSADDNSNKQPMYTIYELMEISNVDGVFATDCMSRLVDEEWRKQSVEIEEGGGDLKERAAKLFSNNDKWKIHTIAFTCFLALLVYHLSTLSRNLTPLDIVMTIYFLSYLAQESDDIKHETCSSLKKYFRSVWNIFDVLALTMLLIGIVWKFVISANSEPVSFLTLFRIKIIFASSFLLWGFRALGKLRSFKFTGPSISMMQSLVARDLLPFISIYGIVIGAFGIFFYQLLMPENYPNPTTWNGNATYLESLVQIYVRPLLLTFGEYDLERLANCIEEEPDKPFKCPNLQGHKVFVYGFIYLFFVIVNLALLNLLIAKFSLTVSTKQDKAYNIWRNYLAESLGETRELTLLPPPLNLIEKISIYLMGCCCKKTEAEEEKPEAEEEKLKLKKRSRRERHFWDDHFHSLPKDYKKFLIFQALSFRGKRHKLSRDTKSHGSPIETLRADVYNKLSDIELKTEESFSSLRQMLAKRKTRREASERKKLEWQSSRSSRRLTKVEN